MTQNSFLSTAQRVIRAEADALTTLAAALDTSFVNAVDMILKAQGRVIVSGIGKSGHIARKIAATLASTGTPAFFVHPAEASHGDLGMVTQHDIVLAISNSGEAPELAKPCWPIPGALISRSLASPAKRKAAYRKPAISCC